MKQVQPLLHILYKEIEVINMMYGTFNPDRLCRVLEQIYSERNENVEVKVRIVSEEEAEIIKKQYDKTA
jgi:hypothetical protein